MSSGATRRVGAAVIEGVLWRCGVWPSTASTSAEVGLFAKEHARAKERVPSWPFIRAISLEAPLHVATLVSRPNPPLAAPRFHRLRHGPPPSPPTAGRGDAGADRQVRPQDAAGEDGDGDVREEPPEGPGLDEAGNVERRQAEEAGESPASPAPLPGALRIQALPYGLPKTQRGGRAAAEAVRIVAVPGTGPRAGGRAGVGRGRRGEPLPKSAPALSPRSRRTSRDCLSAPVTGSCRRWWGRRGRHVAGKTR